MALFETYLTLNTIRAMYYLMDSSLNLNYFMFVSKKFNANISKDVMRQYLVHYTII